MKNQVNYECRRHDTPAKPRVQWGQSPIWNPGDTRTKSNIELRRSGTITRAFVLRLGSAAPLGLHRCVPIINPGLAPWAMQEYRPYRAPLRLPYLFIILMWLPCGESTLGSVALKGTSTMTSKAMWVQCTCFRKCVVLIVVSTRTYRSEYGVLICPPKVGH